MDEVDTGAQGREEALAGYRIYTAALPGVYADPVEIGRRTRAPLYGLTPGLRHYFAVTA